MRTYPQIYREMYTCKLTLSIMCYACCCAVRGARVPQNRQGQCSAWICQQLANILKRQCPASFPFVFAIELTLENSASLETHTSSKVIFHPGYHLPSGQTNAAMIWLETPSKHTPVQLYHTGTVGFEACDGSSRLLQVGV